MVIWQGMEMCTNTQLLQLFLLSALFKICPQTSAFARREYYFRQE